VYINLDLSHNCLQNVIADDIFLLSSLRTLDLSSNAFATDGFLETLFRLTSLTALSIGSVGISGTFPEGLKALSNLESLDISGNYLSGNIENIISTTSLKVLDCSTNRFTGTIPTEIGRLSNLVKWSCSLNDFENVNATKLGASTEFHAKDGVVINCIPSEIGNLSNLRSLELVSCIFSGTIPTEMGRLVELSELHLDSNSLTGTIPTEFGSLWNLTDFTFAGTALTNPRNNSN
jgi:Leucine-rich repeat (LRR) protein